MKGKTPIPPKWTWHYEVLRTLRERLVSERNSQREETVQPLIQDSNDPADCATDEADHRLAFSLLSREESALHEVDAALQRILNGTYGVCEETKTPISAQRLRAIPWTRYKKEVQERLEGQGLVKHPQPARASGKRAVRTKANATPPAAKTANRKKTGTP